MQNTAVIQLESQIAIVDLVAPGEFLPGAWVITRINVPAKFRGQGYGSMLLKKICRRADRHGESLALEIQPSGPLDHDDLRRWYGRHGFLASAKYSGVMIRRPRQCRVSTYGVIVSDHVELGFRCPTHAIDSSDRFGSWPELRKGIRAHWAATIVKS